MDRKILGPFILGAFLSAAICSSWTYFSCFGGIPVHFLFASKAEISEELTRQDLARQKGPTDDQPLPRQAVLEINAIKNSPDFTSPGFSDPGLWSDFKRTKKKEINSAIVSTAEVRRKHYYEGLDRNDLLTLLVQDRKNSLRGTDWENRYKLEDEDLFKKQLIKMIIEFASQRSQPPTANH